MLSDQYDMADFAKDQEFINELLNRYNIEGPFPFNLFINNSNDDIMNADISTCDKIHLKRAIDILQTLLKSRGRELSLKKEMNDKLTDLTLELQIRQASIDRLKSQLESSQIDLRQCQDKLIKSIQQMDKMEKTAQMSKEETNKIRLAYQNKEKQFTHEIRKREYDFERLKEQLQSLLKQPMSQIAEIIDPEPPFIDNVKNEKKEMINDDEDDDYRILLDNDQLSNQLSHHYNTNDYLKKDGENDDNDNDNGDNRMTKVEFENEKLRELLVILSRRIRGIQSSENDQLDERIRSLPIDWLSEIIINNMFDMSNNYNNDNDNNNGNNDREEEDEEPEEF